MNIREMSPNDIDRIMVHNQLVQELKALNDRLSETEIKLAKLEALLIKRKNI